MERNPKVSIIVPVYNVEQYLEQCVESILQQTYKNLDIVLVDDGSKDGSSNMCDEYAARDKRIQVIHKENGGLMSAWMAGVEKSYGDYLVFVDSDDWIESVMIDDLVKHAKCNVTEIICSNYIIEKEKQSVPVKQSMKPGIYEREELEKQLFPELLGNEVRRIHCSRCMKLISKELITKNMVYGNPKITMGEDLNIMFPAMLDAQRMVILEEGFYYHYRTVDASMAHKYNPKLAEKVSQLYQTLYDIIEKKNQKTEEKSMFFAGLKKEYIVLQFFVLKNELRGPKKGVVSRIQTIIHNAKEEAELNNVTLDVTGKANRLLYWIWKTPSMVRIHIGKIAIGIFDRM
ncbi:MAG: glycosyltransferase family 2 protein [Lachnospiraceae bacterium]|nr:glycosyltransferase family 2 protein [Lachnospiraceae bacterium]